MVHPNSIPAPELPGDEGIIALYWSRDESAIAETDRKYRGYLFTVAEHIVHDRLDCEECLNDTYICIWNAIPPTRPRVFKAFITVIMRRVAVNRYYQNTRKSTVPSEMQLSLTELSDFIAQGDVDADFDARRLGTVISAFVRSLPQRRRFIFMSRFYGAEPIDRIAKALSRSMVNKELAAVKSALREALAKEGYCV